MSEAQRSRNRPSRVVRVAGMTGGAYAVLNEDIRRGGIMANIDHGAHMTLDFGKIVYGTISFSVKSSDKIELAVSVSYTPSPPSEHQDGSQRILTMIEIEHSPKGKWVPYRLPAPLDEGRKGFRYLTFGNYSRGGVSIQDVRCEVEDADGIAVHGAGEL